MGFYNLSDNEDLSVVNQNQGVWETNNSNAGAGGIAGWKTNPNTALLAGQSFKFHYDSLSVDKVDRLGYHVRVDGLFPGTNGNTGYVTVVPEPASLLGLAACVAGLVARRRRKV